uniref:Bicarbonate transporter-like transmembrane domain-containing protein n=1 Tax=Amphora coffeiformis TaxID=265554 RepID=A0A7S3L851_9STRA|mmetsp:Transcript_81/g.174  ORF Transcript_81/g.174 Transcript_81/m.174 type:complete len:601 (+) Transcript_81:66-1868(+)
MAPKAEDNYDAEATKRTEIPNDQVMEDAGKVHLDPSQAWGKGLVADVKRTVLTHWVEEMTNFNQKTVAVSLLMFITVIAPTLTFGAVYSTNMDNRIGAVECILATCWTGCFFSLFGGMPTVIVGSTGPVLIMTTVIYDLSQSLDIPFLPFYAWVSIWAFGYCAITAFMDFTRYVKLATRFTDDIFAFLIVSIFILNAMGSPFGTGGLLRYLDPTNKTHEDFKEDLAGTDEDYSMYETALLSIIIGFGTTAAIFFFRGFKNSSYFCNQNVRDMVHDFAVTGAVILFSVIKQIGFSNIETAELNVPDDFEPTFTCCDTSCETFWPDECPEQAEPVGTRPWFAEMSDLNGKSWAPFAAAGPAALAFILFYLDNGITWHLIYNPSNNLQHGDSYNWDLLLNGFANMVNGLLGLPWLVATTVPCIVHLNNLADKDASGKIVKVQETRLTYLISHGLVGFSLLFLPAIKKIPLPVLLGVFLFMGLSSMPGIQFWNRFLLFFQQPSKYPETPYTKYVATSRIHLYTFLQIVFFMGVFIVQNTKSIAIIFPFMTLLCIPGRMYVLPKFMKGWELLLLDGYEEEIEEWLAIKEGTKTKSAAEVEDGDEE